jgi:tetratricopeptide (TPR) repeat protein
MSAKKSVNRQDPLRQLLEVVDKKILVDLVEELVMMHPDVRRECFDYLKAYVKLSPNQQETSEGEAIFALWGELEPDLEELDDYGGGDYSLVDHVADLLIEITKKLATKQVPPEYRTELLNEVLPYIQSSNAGLDDDLYDVAFACCYTDDNLRQLAEAFEKMGREWPIDHARRIYRKIGDHEKYLALRALKMDVGADYHDLATFYWEQGEQEKALLTAKKGLAKGNGQLDELRQFLSDRAQESGDRQGYLKLQFEQTVDHLTLEKYQAFKKLCTKEEWVAYEDDVLKKLTQAWDNEQLKIRMHRKEYDKALATLLKAGYPYDSYSDAYELQVAAKLEERFPEKILGYYQSGLGNLNRSLTRKAYAGKAKVIKKVRHMYVDIMNAPEQWLKFAGQVKLDNKKRPAFQEEMRKAVTGWDKV